MGRVARYKKVKSSVRRHSGGEYIWGSNDGRPTTKKRSQTAEKLKQKKLKRKRKHGVDKNGDDNGYDLPPSGRDEFDLSDLKVKKVKMQNSLMKDDYLVSSSVVSKMTSTPMPSAVITSSNQLKIGNTNVTCTIPKNDIEEQIATKSLQIDPKSGKSKSDNAKTILGRKEGESMRAFNRRLKEQTRLALAQDLKKRNSNIDINAGNVDTDGQNIGKKEKRKEYMKLKKLKKKKGVDSFGNSNVDGNNFQDDDDTSITADQNDIPMLPSFLNQVEAPPSFNQFPRHAKKKKSKHVDNKKQHGMDEKAIKAEQDAMEAIRRKIQAQYSLIKAQRRKEGSFHL